MKRDLEGPIHRSIVAYLYQVLPEGCMVHCCANESHLKGKAAMLATIRKKGMGQITGFPDLLVLPYSHVGAFFLEVKSPKGTLSKPQKAVHEGLRTLGYKVGVVRSLDDVRACLIEFGVGFTEKLPVRGVVR
ncbi:VRR-NUC domain-containing protein [uncultured Roseobacter sp.]|uniref:VRR-NUC domain-containing protein n=1 Tax=uncultured Roseobacter sp. TaxID=114847 RepID=UPI00261039D8|nr:VRR-NUC domain-containing protein [uncultured Roseobacter sp.]